MLHVKVGCQAYSAEKVKTERMMSFGSWTNGCVCDLLIPMRWHVYGRCLPTFQIVHRTLAAMLGSLAALAALAVIGDVRLLSVSHPKQTEKKQKKKQRQPEIHPQLISTWSGGVAANFWEGRVKKVAADNNYNTLCDVYSEIILLNNTSWIIIYSL